MTTSATATNLDHTSDAGFRAWGLEINSQLTAIGLTQTGDTGQIDWTTVLNPPAGSAGYEIWRFNDALQGAAPIFIRIDYGTASADVPGLWAQIGIATDGAGNFVGLSSTALAPVAVGSPVDSLVTPYQNFACYSTVVGALTFAWKLGSAGISAVGRGMLMIGRSCDASGNPTATGATIYTGGVSPAVAQSLRFAAGPVAYAQHSNYGVVVGNVIGSLVGANVQAYLNWANYPQVEPVQWAMSLITDEFPRGTTFLATTVGLTARTFLGLGQASPQSSPGSNAAHYSFGMLYE